MPFESAATDGFESAIYENLFHFKDCRVCSLGVDCVLWIYETSLLNGWDYVNIK